MKMSCVFFSSSYEICDTYFFPCIFFFYINKMLKIEAAERSAFHNNLWFVCTFLFILIFIQAAAAADLFCFFSSVGNCSRGYGVSSATTKSLIFLCSFHVQFAQLLNLIVLKKLTIFRCWSEKISCHTTVAVAAALSSNKRKDNGNA